MVLIGLCRAFAGPPYTSSDKRVRSPLQEYCNDRFGSAAAGSLHRFSGRGVAGRASEKEIPRGRGVSLGRRRFEAEAWYEACPVETPL